MTASALVCTRNRPDMLVRAVGSLLASTSSDLEVIVIDQSPGTESQDALAAFNDPRLRYVRSQATGKGVALNEGFRLARGRIVACTDDDCEVPPDWPAAMARILDEHPTVAVLFCTVLPGPYDSSAGYIPAYQPRVNRLLTTFTDCREGMRLGAGMALRRDVVLELGGFDETFGPGARFASGDEYDLCHRALLKGWHIYETTDVSILHHGFLAFANGRAHTRRDWTSAGASTAKLLRSGNVDAISTSFWTFAVYALWPPVFDALRLRRPRQISRIIGFTDGFVNGLRTPVDRATFKYRR